MSAPADIAGGPERRGPSDGTPVGLDGIVIGRDGCGRPVLAEPRVDIPGLFEHREGESVRLFRLETGQGVPAVVEVTETIRVAPIVALAKRAAAERARRRAFAAKSAREAAELRAAAEGAAIRATAERARHGEVFEMDRAPEGERGPDSRPQRVGDRWIRMARDGKIDGPSLTAAHQFRRDFGFAGLETMHSAPLERKVDGGVGPGPNRSDRQVDAVNAVWGALRALGGIGRPAGSIVYACVGLERTVKEWCWQEAAATGYRADEKRAAGILFGALAALAGYFTHQDARPEVRQRFETRGKRGGGR